MWPESHSHGAQDGAGGQMGNTGVLLGFAGGPRGWKPRPVGHTGARAQRAESRILFLINLSENDMPTA